MATTQNGIYYQDDYTKSADILADMQEMAESIDGVIEEEKETTEQTIQELQTEQTAQNKKIEQLDDNQIHITTEKSSNINVQDASGQNAKIKLFGISEQETRSGINLTNYEDWTEISGNEQITEKDDDKVVCAITSSSYGVCDIERTLKPNTNYTACADFEFNGTFGNQYGLRVNVNGSITSLKTDGLVNFTTDETGKARMQCYVGFPYTGANATLTVSNIRLYEGTYTRENIPDYEQYGASPSPEYPAEIKNTTGDIDITVCNKNLLKIENIDDKWELIKNRIINKNAVAGDDIAYLKLKKGETIKLGLVLFSKPSSSTTFSCFVNNSSSQLLDLTFSNFQNYILNNKYEKTYIAEEDCTLRFRYFGNTENEKFEFQFWAENNNLTDYIENEQQVTTFPLVQGQKMYEGDYLADDGIHHKRKQIVLDGTENWVLSGLTTNNQYILTVSDIKIIGENNKGNLISSHFKEITGVEGYNNNNINGISGWSSTQIRISLDISIINRNVAKFKNWLAQQKTNGTPVIVEYPLAEETIEEYTEEEQQTAYNQTQNAKTYKTVTNVFTENAEAEMEYIADTKTYIDNKTTNIQNQLNTINQLLSTTGTSALLLDNMQTDLESEVL